MKPPGSKFLAIKHLLNPLVLIFLLTAVVSCRKQAEVITADPVIINSITDFEFASDPADAFKFTFKNLSVKYKKVEWRFGDDTLSTTINPVHIYSKPGKYIVDLTTYSETGATSRKLVNILISPDSVMKIVASKTGVLNEIAFGITVKATIASILWTFGDVTPAATSSSLTPTRSYVPGSSNTVTAKVTTTSGSVVSLTINNATTEGLVEDITQLRDGYTISADNTLNAAENSTKVLDNNVETKFTMGGKDGRLFTYPLILTLNYTTAQTVKLYAIGNSNDLPVRDPKAWRVEGSNDGTTWEILDNRTMTKNFYDQMTALGATTDLQRFKKLFSYNIANPKPFKKYRWVITANWGDAAMQTNEFRLYR